MSFSFVTEKAGKLACGLLTAGACLLGGSAHAQVRITEVAAWSSGNSPVGADWFELTNFGASAVSLTGWSMDDESATAGVAPLVGVASLPAGKSAIFIDGSGSANATFINTWFGGSAPADFLIGNYTGSGIGLGTGGDTVNIFDGSSALQAKLLFGPSPSGPTFATFDNAAGVNDNVTAFTQLSVVGVNGGFIAANDVNEIGSPGTITSVPEPTSAMLLVLGLVGCGYAARKRVR
jgi:hypothetical protein